MYRLWGMEFNSVEDVPDFGSIYCVNTNDRNVNEYGLNSSDISKLSLITNAAPGSTALCDDTADIYRLTKTGWVKFGDDENEESTLEAQKSAVTSGTGDEVRGDDK